MHNDPHHYYMSRALELAKQGRLTVSPNPMVGCVIVNQNEIIATGYHQQAGGAHAEIHALQAAGSKAIGATVYTTLEPCCHFGKTPPCTESLIKADIKKIVVACLDPNPRMNGKSIEKLRAGGIEVVVGIGEEEAKQLNEIFFHYMRFQRPFVIAKWAMSWDGKTITHPQDNKQISGKKSHVISHDCRQAVDAILIGARTALEDDPSLTVRFSSLKSIKAQPKRIILSTEGKLPTHLKIFNDEFAQSTIVATTKELANFANHQNKIETIILPKDDNGQVDLLALLTTLGEKNITSLLVEGGRTVHESFLSRDLVNKIHVYLSPVIIGRYPNKKKLNKLTIQPLDEDYHLTANLSEE